MKTLLCIVVTAGVLAGAAIAATPPASTNPCSFAYVAPVGEDAAAACSKSIPKPPAIPIANSTTLTRAAFTQHYDTVWSYLSPRYQSAVSHAKWLSCQKRNPVAPQGLRIDRIAVAGSGNIPVNLALFGNREVFQVQMQVIFTRAGTQAVALAFTYWFHDKGKWVAVWLPTVYQAYTSGRCDPAGPTRGLY